MEQDAVAIFKLQKRMKNLKVNIREKYEDDICPKWETEI